MQQFIESSPHCLEKIGSQDSLSLTCQDNVISIQNSQINIVFPVVMKACRAAEYQSSGGVK